MPSRRAAFLATLLVVLAAVFAASTATGADRAAGIAAPKPVPREPVPLKAGRYATTVFKPALSFTLGSGWRVLTPEDTRFLTLVKGDLLLAFMRPIRVVDPTRTYTTAYPASETLLPLPRDLVRWLAQHPRMSASGERSVVIAGRRARQIDTVVKRGYRYGGCPTSCVLLFATRPDFVVWAGVGNKMRTTVASVAGSTVVFGLLLPSERSFTQGVGEGDRVLRSVRLGVGS